MTVMAHASSRRLFFKTLVGAAAIGDAAIAVAQSPGGIRGFDHVALPMQNVAAMLAFYHGLGLRTNESANAVSVYVGDQMINFHRPTLWQNPQFTLKAPKAAPPCGDLCFVWDGTPESLTALIAKVGVPVVEGPVVRSGGRARQGSSTYIRDPDGNLLEFIIYPPPG
jgi:catechol 2,3-dioxygenase-like lactoylglutathione lyase family enzyme